MGDFPAVVVVVVGAPDLVWTDLDLDLDCTTTTQESCEARAAATP